MAACTCSPWITDAVVLVSICPHNARTELEGGIRELSLSSASAFRFNQAAEDLQL